MTAQLQNNVGYIKLRQFTQNADSLVRQAIEELSSQGAQSFVLDLRDNPGGYLNKAVDVASLFVKSGVVVEIDTVDAQTTKQVSGNVATDAQVPPRFLRLRCAIRTVRRWWASIPWAAVLCRLLSRFRSAARCAIPPRVTRALQGIRSIAWACRLTW